MQIVLLAAGLGSRLGDQTRTLPKALIQVAGDPLVVHALRFATLLAPSKVIVVGGYGFAQVNDELAQRQRGDGPLARLPIALVENRDFRDGNLISLMTARPAIDDDFLLLNVDHIYNPRIAPVVQRPVGDVTAFIDTDRQLGDDDMKVERDARGHVHKIAKTLTKFDCGYVGMTRVPGDARERYWQEADAALAQEGRTIHVERVLARLAAGDHAPNCRDISGHGWWEVDTPDERARADEGLRAARWR